MSVIAASSASLHSRCHSRDVGGHLADDERARHVGEACRLVVARPDVDHDRDAGVNRPVAHVVADRALRAGRDDELVRARAVLRRTPRHRRLHALDRQRLAVDDERVAVRRRPAGGARARRPSRPRPRAARGGCLRARPRSSTRRRSSKNAPSTVSSTPSARSRSASQIGKVSGTTARSTPSAATARTAISRWISALRAAGRDQLVGAELLERVQLVARRPRRAAAISIEPTTMWRTPSDSTYRNGSGTPSGTSWRSSGERNVSA